MAATLKTSALKLTVWTDMPNLEGVLKLFLSYHHNTLKSTNIWTGAFVQWLKLHTWKVGDRGFEPHSGLPSFKETKCFFPVTRKDSILWEPLWPKGSVLGHRPPGLEFRVLYLEGRPSPHHPQEVPLARFSLDVHRCGRNPNLFIHSHQFSRFQTRLKVWKLGPVLMTNRELIYIESC